MGDRGKTLTRLVALATLSRSAGEGLRRIQLKAPRPHRGRAVRGNLDVGFLRGFPLNFATRHPLPGLVPGIHALTPLQSGRRRRGWPGQARPRGSSLVVQHCGLSTTFDAPDSPARRRRGGPSPKRLVGEGSATSQEVAISFSRERSIASLTASAAAGLRMRRYSAISARSRIARGVNHRFTDQTGGRCPRLRQREMSQRRDLSRHALHEGGGRNDWDFPERVER